MACKAQNTLPAASKGESLLALVEHIRVVETERHQLDCDCIADGLSFAEKVKATRAHSRVECRINAMIETAKTLPVENLQDAAAALVMGFDEVDRIGAGVLDARQKADDLVRHLRWMIVSCLPVVARAAGVDLDRVMTPATADLVFADLGPSADRAGQTPDAELIRTCAQHIENMRTYNAAPDLAQRLETDPRWLAYQGSRDAISAATPQTLEGVLAVARAAVAESQGAEPEHHGCDERWAWLAATSLVRLHGEAVP